MAKLVGNEPGIVEAARIKIPNSVAPQDAIAFLAFVVWIPDSDEFLQTYHTEGDVWTWQWIKGMPILAFRFPRLKRAQRVAWEKPQSVVAVLFDTPRQFTVVPIDD